MLAARDQENLVHGLQQVAASKPLNQSTRSLQPKTPGNRFPKTPLKVPLNDENGPGLGGKSVKGKGVENLGQGKTFDKNAFVTPIGPRTRAPLGMKTTNAKAKGFQTPAPAQEKDLSNTQAPKTSARRPKKVTHADTVKLQIHGDESPLQEREVEYCPPKPKDLPYESDVFPDGCLDYTAVKPENLMRGISEIYRRVDENGLTRLERQYQDDYTRRQKEGEERMKEMMEEVWTVGDVPETFQQLKKRAPAPVKPTANRAPATITSRNAASALSVAPKSTIAPPKMTNPVPKPTSFLSRAKPALIPSNPSTLRHNAAMATSKSTIGYTKGRSASNVLHKDIFSKPTLQKKEGGLKRSESNMSDTTITPANYGEREEKNLDWLRAFDEDEEDVDPLLLGKGVECLRGIDDEEDEFVLTLSSAGPASS